ncbi:MULTISPECIES: O-antigen polymerase [Streptomyces]|uniref:O-antigen polymerase n=1 Tax=Streptomyces TaxID=1883 RepID=UPI00148782DA|nr:MULTISPECIES: O-antigen polymerase [Streptomyces]
MVLSVLPGVLIATLVSDASFRSWWRTPKLFTGTMAALVLTLLAAFVAGVLLATMERSSDRAKREQRYVVLSPVQQRLLLHVGRLLIVLTFAGYAAWLLIGVVRGLHLAQLFAVVRLEAGAIVEVKRLLTPVAGVTTQVQFGPLAAACLMVHQRATGKNHYVAITMLLLLATVRALIHAERLALLEVITPMIVLAAVLAPRPRTRIRLPSPSRPSSDRKWALAPLAAPALLICVFGTFEYTRSWNDYYSRQGGSYQEFVVHRLGGYYATPANNFGVLRTYLAPHLELPYYTMKFLWNFPGLHLFIDRPLLLGIEPESGWKAALFRYANPEFNNEGGILPSVVDYGPFGAVVFWGVLGYGLGRCYRALRAGHPGALLLYSVLFIGTVELARYFYWGQGRAIPGILAAVLLSWALHSGRDRREERP